MGEKRIDDNKIDAITEDQEEGYPVRFPSGVSVTEDR